jgi:hypothetical protein
VPLPSAVPEVAAGAVEEVAAYFASRPHARASDPAFATRTGGRRDKDNIRKRVVAPAVARANRERYVQAQVGHADAK